MRTMDLIAAFIPENTEKKINVALKYLRSKAVELSQQIEYAAVRKETLTSAWAEQIL